MERHGLSPQEAGPVRDALMVCRVTVPTTRTYDGGKRLGFANNAPDLDVVVAIADEPPALFRGEHNEYSACVAVPLVDLDEGDEVRMRLWDRNPTKDQPLGSIQGSFSGAFPLVVDNDDGIEARCNFVAPPVLDAHVTAETLPTIDERLTEYQEALDEKRLGMPALLEDRRRMKWALEVGASDVGWTDSRIERRRKALGELTKKAAQSVSTPRAKDPKFSFGMGTLHGTLERIECGVENTEELFPRLKAPMAWPALGSGCRLVGTLTAVGNRAGDVHSGGNGDLLTAYLITMTGEMIELGAHVEYGGFFGDDLSSHLVEQRMPRGKALPLRLEPKIRPVDFRTARYGGAWGLWLKPRDPSFDDQKRFWTGVLLPVDALAAPQAEAKTE